MYELRTKLPKFTHEFLDRNFPLRRPRISSRAVDAVKSSWNNSIHTQTLFIYLFNRLTFSVSSTRPEAGDAAERDGAQNPPLVGWSHAAADQGGWSALNVKSGGELHQVVGLKWSVWVCMSVCVLVCACVCVGGCVLPLDNTLPACRLCRSEFLSNFLEGRVNSLKIKYSP